MWLFISDREPKIDKSTRRFCGLVDFITDHAFFVGACVPCVVGAWFGWKFLAPILRMLWDYLGIF